MSAINSGGIVLKPVGKAAPLPPKPLARSGSLASVLRRKLADRAEALNGADDDDDDDDGWGDE